MKLSEVVFAATAALPLSSTNAAEVEPVADLPANVHSLRAKALTGDRQAMKNLGYTYASGAFEMKGRRLPIAGCAWLLAIPWVHPRAFQTTDTNNIAAYCNPLSHEDLERAYRHAASIVETVTKAHRT